MNSTNTPQKSSSDIALAVAFDHDIIGGNNDHLEGCIHTPPELGHYPLYALPEGSLFQRHGDEHDLQHGPEHLDDVALERAQLRAEFTAMMARPLVFAAIENPTAWYDSKTGTMNFAGLVPQEGDEMPLWMRHYEGFPHSHNEHADADEGDAS